MAEFDPDKQRLGHDLRTRLTVIRGHAQLLQRHVRRMGGADPRFLAGLAAIDDAVTAIGEIIERFETTDPCDRAECPDLSFTDA